MTLWSFRELRIAKGIDVECVAVSIGVNTSQLKEYEDDSGTIPCSVALKLCEYYGVVSFDDIDF